MLILPRGTYGVAPRLMIDLFFRDVPKELPANGVQLDQFSRFELAGEPYRPGLVELAEILDKLAIALTDLATAVLKPILHRSWRERLLESMTRTDRVTAFPSGANFVLFRVAGDGHALWQELVARGVLVRDFSRWPRLAECLRVTVGTEQENDAFLDALRDSLREVAA